MAVIIRSGTKSRSAVDTARELIANADWKLGNMARMSVESMCAISGIGEAKALSIVAACEIGRRIASEITYDNPVITSARTAAEIMRPLLGSLKHEECWLLYLNKGRRLIGRERISQGGVDMTVMDIKLIVKRAVEKLSSYIILVHNHPSGNPAPSKQDRSQTEALRKAATMLDIVLCDHIIIANEKYFSFSEEIIVKFA